MIFRLDYKVNYDITSRPGTVMRLLDSMGDEYEDDLRENQQRRQVLALYKTKDISSSLTVDPNSISCTIESLEGTPFGNIAEKYKVFHDLLKIVDLICKEFSINELTRSGFRIFYFNHLLDDAQIYKSFYSFYSKELTQGLEENLGGISDVAIIFDGSNEDKLLYHLKAGPYTVKDEATNKETSRYMPELAKEFETKHDYNFVCDLDIYENNVAIPYGAFVRWCKPHLLRAQKSIENIEKLIEKNSGS